MSVDAVAEIDDATQFLLELAGGSYACIYRDLSRDLTNPFLAKANQLASTGVRVRIVCVDDLAANRYRMRFADYPSLGPADVVTIEQMAMRILAEARVGASVGRDPRVLSENEIDVLMEDMKVSGLKPRRLREMFKFFCKGISDCDSEGDGWLINNEERRLFSLLSENLEARRAMLPCELSSFAYQGMLKAGVEPPPLAVLADDFGMLSKASQRLVEHVATAGLIVAGTRLAAVGSAEPYPHNEGFLSFARRHDAAWISLEEETPAARRVCQSCDNPEDEFSFVAEAVSQRVADGLEPRDVLVAVPNETWLSGMANALERRGLVVGRDRGCTKAKGDPRVTGRFNAMKLATFLKLYLKSDDLVALRSWMGFGDWLLRSDAFWELVSYARDRDASVLQIVTQLLDPNGDRRDFKAFDKLRAPLEELSTLLIACRAELSCKEAAELFKKHDMALSLDQIALLGDDPACADVKSLAVETCMAVASDGGDNAVTIAPYRRCHGRFPRVTFITGLIDGFMPATDAVDDKFTIDHRRAAFERELVLFEDMAATAREEVVCTLFRRDELEHAAMMNMQVSRVFIEGDVRYATVVPSSALRREQEC